VKQHEVGNLAGDKQARAGLAQRSNGCRALKRRGIASANAARTLSFGNRSNGAYFDEFAPCPNGQARYSA
jgi:hypothetical protein